MNGRWFRVGAIAAATVGVSLLLTFGIVAQRAAHNGRTPHLANGKPDLTGVWAEADAYWRPTIEGKTFTATFPTRRCGPTQKKCLGHTNQSYDGEFMGRFNPNRPLYKPEYWDKVQQLDYDTNFVDPTLKCQPHGVPRMGPPTKIVQLADEVIFLYAGSDALASPASFRVIPADGRKHDPESALDVTFYGHSVGAWEGDTLVIDSVGFNDITWLERGGYFHSDNMRVIEKFRREGNTLFYDVTVEDPDVLLQPWVKDTRELRLNTGKYTFIEQSPCKERYDAEQMHIRVRH